jgi:uncharacterized protein (DUF2147 family)
MKIKFLWIAIITLLNSTWALAQTANLAGVWYNQEKTSKIQVYKGNDNQYYGKIIWLQEPLNKEGKPKTDMNNPNSNARMKPLLNLNILKLKKNKGEVYEGKIYDPKNGKEYDCVVSFENENLLKIRGYVGHTLFGRTSYWYRAE